MRVGSAEPPSLPVPPIKKRGAARGRCLDVSAVLPAAIGHAIGMAAQRCGGGCIAEAVRVCA